MLAGSPRFEECVDRYGVVLRFVGGGIHAGEQAEIGRFRCAPGRYDGETGAGDVGVIIGHGEGHGIIR